MTPHTAVATCYGHAMGEWVGAMTRWTILHIHHTMTAILSA